MKKLVQNLALITTPQQSAEEEVAVAANFPIPSAVTYQAVP